jgi:hypothetical protein
MKFLSELDGIIDKFIESIDKSKGKLMPILKWGGMVAMLYLGYRLWKYYAPKLESHVSNEENQDEE